MNAIRTIDMIPCVTNLRGIVNYSPIGFGLLVYSLLKNLVELLTFNQSNYRLGHHGIASTSITSELVQAVTKSSFGSSRIELISKSFSCK